MAEILSLEDVVKANEIFMKMNNKERKQLPKLRISEQEINYSFAKAVYNLNHKEN
ncbi:Uncharacterised protein [uncultured archaeon]|nr:Uncharacterised protein [uncultured archaeon]